jgi:hypothetical protein
VLGSIGIHALPPLRARCLVRVRAALQEVQELWVSTLKAAGRLDRGSTKESKLVSEVILPSAIRTEEQTRVAGNGWPTKEVHPAVKGNAQRSSLGQWTNCDLRTNATQNGTVDSALDREPGMGGRPNDVLGETCGSIG